MSEEKMATKKNDLMDISDPSLGNKTSLSGEMPVVKPPSINPSSLVFRDHHESSDDETDTKEKSGDLDSDFDLSPTEVIEIQEKKGNEAARQKNKELETLVNLHQNMSKAEMLKPMDMIIDNNFENIHLEDDNASVQTIECAEAFFTQSSTKFDFFGSETEKKEKAEGIGSKKKLGKKRSISDRSHVPDDEKVTCLKDLQVTEHNSSNEVSADITRKLFESKEDLIRRVVMVLGKKLAIGLFNDVKRIMETRDELQMNFSGSQSPGDLYFHRIKTDATIPTKLVELIFEDTREMYYAIKKSGLLYAQPRGKDISFSVRNPQLPIGTEKKVNDELRAAVEQKRTKLMSDEQVDEEESDSEEFPFESIHNNTPKESQEDPKSMKF